MATRTPRPARKMKNKKAVERKTGGLAARLANLKEPIKPGERRGGRQKGVPNKTTRILKEAILIAAENVGKDGKGRDGLVGYLEMVAKREIPSFCALLGRVLPMQINVSDDTSKTAKTPEEIREALIQRGIPVPEFFYPPPTAMIDVTPVQGDEKTVDADDLGGGSDDDGRYDEETSDDEVA